MRYRGQQWTWAAWAGTLLGGRGRSHLARGRSRNESDSQEEQLPAIEKRPWSPHHGVAACTGGVSSSKWLRQPWGTWDLSLTLWFPSKVAGPAHAPKGSLHPCSFGQAGQGGWLRGALARASRPAHCWEDDWSYSIFCKKGGGGKDRGVHKACKHPEGLPTAGNPRTWERTSFAGKTSWLFSQRALWGYEYLHLTRSVS